MLLILTIFLLLKKDTITYQIETMIEEEKNYVISITYPKTNIKKLNQRIKNDILKEIKKIKEKERETPYLINRDELNIDFEYFLFDNRYINIILKSDLYHGNTNQNSYELYSYLYDSKKRKIIDIKSLFQNQESVYGLINDEIKNKYQLTITSTHNLPMIIMNNELKVYFITNKIYSVTIPLTELDLTIKWNLSNEKEKEENTKIVSNIIDPSKKIVAITFDDGPSQYTKDIIKTLKEYDCNATFFVLGNKVEAYQDIIKESIKNGNEIGNHSYNHKWLSRLSKEEIINQIEKTQNILKKTVNYTPTHLRPTYGSVNNKIRKNTDLEITLWTIDTKDWRIKNVDRIVERALNNVSDGDIILMHDIFERSSNALKIMIPKLKEAGYQLVTISELEEVKLLRNKY